ncbi:unnamed protein product [Amoebophrya sp. A25]|nr:unnamed protein product [Amoebophrya sp. A25]|eukprot:GSA25T00008225001.1
MATFGLGFLNQATQNNGHIDVVGMIPNFCALTRENIREKLNDLDDLLKQGYSDLALKNAFEAVEKAVDEKLRREHYVGLGRTSRECITGR